MCCVSSRRKREARDIKRKSIDMDYRGMPVQLHQMSDKVASVSLTMRTEREEGEVEEEDRDRKSRESDRDIKKERERSTYTQVERDTKRQRETKREGVVLEWGMGEFVGGDTHAFASETISMAA